MIIALASDLHLEFGAIEHEKMRNTEGADVLVLSGDICLAKDLVKKNDRHEYVMDFWRMINDEWQQVIYIMGNHEHYGSDYNQTPEIIRDALSSFGNIHFLEKQRLDIGGVHFLAGSLWTDFNKANPMTLQLAKEMMNDYKAIKDKTGLGYKLWPQTILDDHRQCMEFLREELDRIDGKAPAVVIDRHAPSEKSTHPRYEGQDTMNALFVSALDDFILEHPNIKIWTHGHVHDRWEYEIGETRVLCNPRGYINIEIAATDWEMRYYRV